jgi:hypothetical protein
VVAGDEPEVVGVEVRAPLAPRELPQGRIVALERRGRDLDLLVVVVAGSELLRVVLPRHLRIAAR